MSHGTEETRLTWSALDLALADPELVVIVTPQAPSAQDRELAPG